MMNKVYTLLFLTLLTSCKTLENRVDLSKAGLKTAAKSFTSSINPFEKKANEYKKLISDKKYDEAELFLKNNIDYFGKRYQKTPSLVEEEVKELSDYLIEDDLRLTKLLEQFLPSNIHLLLRHKFYDYSYDYTYNFKINSLISSKVSKLVSLISGLPPGKSNLPL